MGPRQHVWVSWSSGAPFIASMGEQIRILRILAIVILTTQIRMKVTAQIPTEKKMNAERKQICEKSVKYVTKKPKIYWLNKNYIKESLFFWFWKSRNILARK